MTKIAILAAACGLVLARQAAAEPLDQTNACQAALHRTAAEWDAIGFATPSKPAQARVPARDGRVASGSEVTYLASQLRQAAVDCAAGRDESGLQRTALVRAHLDRLDR
jgi:hypothetical protein